MTLPNTLATAQRSLGDPDISYPLWPALTRGCPRTSTDTLSYPVDVDYAYERVDTALFEPGYAARHGIPRGAGIERWAPLLPPLDAPSLGEGGTPLIEFAPGVHIKDEARNPTWSHKDRLNRCTTSAAVRAGAPGVVVASSGNHGAAAAAYAARAGLRCVVFTSTDTPPAVDAFLHAYGAVVLPVPIDHRWPLVRKVVEHCGLHPVSNLTATHTGHAYGAEGYKTIAYEIHAELGAPAAVFVPTGYGELLYGVWKGFAELQRLGVTDSVPRIFACEPAAGGPLAAAVRAGVPATTVEVGDTDAYGIDCSVGGYRGVVALRASQGRPLLLTDDEMRSAQRELAAAGLWVELSAAAGLAGLRQVGDVEGPVVCVSTSSGFKDVSVGTRTSEPVDPAWDEVRRRLRAAGIDA
ncbi:threonine synthase [Streptomyces buecherae]|uniref:threonine synthase n=1 Tax=Streptomyces buecherae TaxID=2763006 RepID=UPI0036499257